MSTCTELEILEFVRPEGNQKNLYITGIPWMEEDELLDKFYQLFIAYGPVYGIHLYPATVRNSHQISEPDTPPFNTHSDLSDPTKQQTAVLSGGDEEHTGYYAFVTFYLAMSAKRSKEDLKNRLVIHGKECKISYAKRTKEKKTTNRTLHFTRCQDLANHYMGFNGWSTAIKLIECDSEIEEGQTKKLRFVCVVRLDISGQSLYTNGLGAWEESYVVTEPTSRAKAVCKAKKLSYQRAVEDAFSRVILLILANGKVSVEIDTTRPDVVLTEKLVNEDDILKINQLDTEPEDEKDENESLDDLEDIDAVNLHILHQLEDEM